MSAPNRLEILGHIFDHKQKLPSQPYPFYKLIKEILTKRLIIFNELAFGYIRIQRS